MARDQTDRQKLAQIIRTLNKVLQDVDNSRNLIFASKLRIALHGAWIELKTDRTLENLEIRISQNPDEPSDSSLKVAGLAGKQLHAKHVGIMDSYQRLNKQGGIRQLKSVLRWGLLILGSIATLVPGINEAAEVIKEHMEGIQIGIENSEET